MYNKKQFDSTNEWFKNKGNGQKWKKQGKSNKKNFLNRVKTPLREKVNWYRKRKRRKVYRNKKAFLKYNKYYFKGYSISTVPRRLRSFRISDKVERRAGKIRKSVSLTNNANKLLKGSDLFGYLTTEKSLLAAFVRLVFYKTAYEIKSLNILENLLKLKVSYIPAVNNFFKFITENSKFFNRRKFWQNIFRQIQYRKLNNLKGNLALKNLFMHKFFSGKRKENNFSCNLEKTFQLKSRKFLLFLARDIRNNHCFKLIRYVLFRRVFKWHFYNSVKRRWLRRRNKNLIFYRTYRQLRVYSGYTSPFKVWQKSRFIRRQKFGGSFISKMAPLILRFEDFILQSCLLPSLTITKFLIYKGIFTINGRIIKSSSTILKPYDYIGLANENLKSIFKIYYLRELYRQKERGIRISILPCYIHSSFKLFFFMFLPLFNLKGISKSYSVGHYKFMMGNGKKEIE